MRPKLSLHARFKRDLGKLLKKHDAMLELTDHESERNYSMWVFFKGKMPLDLGRKQPNG